MTDYDRPNAIHIDTVTAAVRSLGLDSARVQRLDIDGRSINVTELVLDDEGEPVMVGDGAMRVTYSIPMTLDEPTPSDRWAEKMVGADADDVPPNEPCGGYEGSMTVTGICDNCGRMRAEHWTQAGGLATPVDEPKCADPGRCILETTHHGECMYDGPVHVEAVFTGAGVTEDAEPECEHYFEDAPTGGDPTLQMCVKCGIDKRDDVELCDSVRPNSAMMCVLDADHDGVHQNGPITWGAPSWHPVDCECGEHK